MNSEARPVRYRCELFGLLSMASGEPLKVRVLDLSETGAFVERPEAEEELQEGDAVSLALSLPGVGMWTTGARVSRLGTSRLELKRAGAAHVTVTREGHGIEFVELPDEGLEQLRDFLELLDQR